MRFQFSNQPNYHSFSLSPIIPTGLSSLSQNINIESPSLSSSTSLHSSKGKASSRRKGAFRKTNKQNDSSYGFEQRHQSYTSEIDVDMLKSEFDDHNHSHQITTHTHADNALDMNVIQSQQHQQQTGTGHINRYQNHQKAVSKLLSHIMPPNQNNPNRNLVSATAEWKALQRHKLQMDETHLRDLLQDEERSESMFAVHDGVYLDYSRQRTTLETMDLLYDLAERQGLKEKINAMVSGEKINWTEDRAVLHTALRGKRPPNDMDITSDDTEKLIVDGDDVMDEVWEVLDQIKYFTEAVRSGKIRGFTGKRLRNIISVGIGGSYLGPEFLHECLKTEPEGINKSLGYTLRFLSNVDPVDVERACADLDPEETLIVIVSKTFTTAETMLNARTMRQWLWDFMGDDKEVVRKHVIAVSSISSLEKVEAFGIDTKNYFFRFWDWVGGRYSVCSAVGGIPISLLYGFDLFEKFLQVSFQFEVKP